MMNTKTWVVGQHVYVISNSGIDFLQGKVTEVTPEGFEVRVAGFVLGVENLSQFNYDVDQMLYDTFRFDSEGNNGTNAIPGWERNWEESGFDWNHCRIDDMPFSERRRGHV
jgi:hypothetical protein